MADEKRLIDAMRLERLVNNNRSNVSPQEDVLAAIVKQPTVDAVEVVRCKNCIYYHKTVGIAFGQCSKTSLFPYDNDFCSYGERKTDG